MDIEKVIKALGDLIDEGYLEENVVLVSSAYIPKEGATVTVNITGTCHPHDAYELALSATAQLDTIASTLEQQEVDLAENEVKH